MVSCHFKRAEFIFQTKKFPFTIIVCIFYLLPSAFFLLLFNLCFTKYGDRIIVHIRWRLGNLKKTYLGDHRLPMFEWLIQKAAFKHQHVSTLAPLPRLIYADVWTCRCLNVPMFEWALPTNVYDYMLPWNVHIKM